MWQVVRGIARLAAPRPSRGRAPRCGRCGYDVTGLTTFVCPECGADLHEVGIVGRTRPPHAKHPKTVQRRVTWWTLLVAVPALATTIWVANIGWPYRILDYYTLDLIPQKPVFQHLQLRIIASGVASDFSQMIRPLEVDQLDAQTVLSSGKPLRLEIVRGPGAGLEHEELATVVHSISVFDAAEIVAWLKQHGVNTSADVETAVARAVDRLRRMNEEQTWNPSQTYTAPSGDTWRMELEKGALTKTDPFHSGRWSILTIILVLLFWAAIWLIGTVRLLRRGRSPATEGTEPVARDQRPPPSDAIVARTLTIMFVDLVNYSGEAASRPREGLIALIRRLRDLVQPVAAERGGRIIKGLGDGLLVTFDGTTDAVLAAVQIQAATRARDSFAAKLDLRIGIATGEVTLHDGDVFGQTVNLASRLQQIAKPGDVLFSDVTCAMLNKSEVRYEPVGPVELKGIAGAVTVFKALSAPPETVTSKGDGG